MIKLPFFVAPGGQPAGGTAFTARHPSHGNAPGNEFGMLVGLQMAGKSASGPQQTASERGQTNGTHDARPPVVFRLAHEMAGTSGAVPANDDTAADEPSPDDPAAIAPDEADGLGEPAADPPAPEVAGSPTAPPTSVVGSDEPAAVPTQTASARSGQEPLPAADGTALDASAAAEHADSRQRHGPTPPPQPAPSTAAATAAPSAASALQIAGGHGANGEATALPARPVTRPSTEGSAVPGATISAARAGALEAASARPQRYARNEGEAEGGSRQEDARTTRDGDQANPTGPAAAQAGASIATSRSQSPAAAAAATALGTASTALSKALGDQFTVSRIQEFNGGHTKLMKLQLQPAHLGQLDIVLKGTDGRLTVEIQTRSAEAQNILTREKASLRTALDDANLTIENLSIDPARDRRIASASPAQAGSSMNEAGQGSGERFDGNRSSSEAGQNRSRNQSSPFNRQAHGGEPDGRGDAGSAGTEPRPGSGLRI